MDVKNTTNIGTVKIIMLKGEAGNSIASIEKTSSTEGSEIYTITLTDGSTTTIEVERGRGIASIEKTATVGLVDTYTITFTDETTTTFDVINGQSYTVPTDGIIYYDGATVPEGYDVTSAPAGGGIFTDVTGTLIAGQTSLTLSNVAITTNSTIDIYTDSYGVNPTAVSVTNGSVTLTFDEQSTDLIVKVRVS